MDSSQENIKYKQENNLQYWKINKLKNILEELKEMELGECKGVIYKILEKVQEK